LTVPGEFKRRAAGRRLSAAFLQRQASKSNERKARIAENYRGSPSDPKDFGNKIQPNQ
jgi:hypothetical protein